MRNMCYKLSFVLACSLLTVSVNAKNIDAESAERLEALLGLGLAELQEVEVKLDDVFDIFDGLLKRPKVRVASGFEQDVATAPAVTTVITAQDIEATGSRSLEEVLRVAPGLHVNRLSSNMAAYTIRGILSGQNFEVLFLVDGVPLKTALDGNRSLFDIAPPVHHISRIEIIRGPGSAVYGADAFAGVINIITKTAEEIGGKEVGARVGSFDTHDLWALYGDKWGDVEIAAALQYEATDGPRRTIERDSMTLVDEQLAALIPGYQPASFAPGPFTTGEKVLDLNLDLRYGDWQARFLHQSMRDREVGLISLSVSPDSFADIDYSGVDLRWQGSNLSENWDASVELSFRRFSQELQFFGARNMILPGDCPGGFCFYPDGTITRNKETELQWRVESAAFYSGFDNHLIRVGLGYSLEDLPETTSATNRGLDRFGNFIQPEQGVVDISDGPTERIPEVDRKNWHVSFQDTWDLAENWQLTAGIRYDDYSDFGSTTNPRAALVWQTTPNLSTKLLYGRAFRAPSFTEAFIFSDAFIFGSSDLQPETIDTLELAFDYQITPDLHAALNIFHYEIEDKILLVSTDSGSFAYRNAGIWEGDGFEFEGRWKVSTRAALLFNYAYVNVETFNFGQQYDRGNYPHHTVYLRGDWLFQPDWYLDAQVNAVLDRDRPVDDPRSPSPNYVTVDLAIRYKTIDNHGWNFAAGIKNLFDDDVREPGAAQTPNDLPQAGRNWFAEVRYRFE